MRSLTSGREFVRDALVNTPGLLGRFINILMLLVFPYIILGALFKRCRWSGLIKLAFSLTRNLRGGPAHAAVVSSATAWYPPRRRAGGQCAVDRGPDHPDDAEARLFKGVCRGCRSRGVLRGSIMPPIMGVAPSSWRR